MSGQLSWKDVLMDRLQACGLDSELTQKAYLAEMEARAFFEFGGIVPDCLRLQNIEQNDKEICYYWTSDSHEASCPLCGVLSTRPFGDYFTKPVQDIPRDGKAVYHRIRFQKYHCENPECIRKLFVERFADFCEEDARKTIRFKQHGIYRALGSGCHRTEMELRGEGAIISNDTLGRYVKSSAAMEIELHITQDTVKVLCMDDIHLRKGDKTSGLTVLLDGETHKVLIILCGTTKEIAKRAIEQFPSAQFFSRDRATAYAAAGAECEKTQIADRFHWIKNAQDAVKQALMAHIPAKIFIREGNGWMKSSPETSSDERSYYYVDEERTAECIRLAGLSQAKATRYRRTLQLLELSDKGLKTADIAKEMGMAYRDVQTLRRSAAATLQDAEERMKKRVDAQNEAVRLREEERSQHPPKTVGGPYVRPARQSIVAPYRETVITMVKTGGNHRTIFPIIREMGYTGSENAIYQYIIKLRKEEPEQLHPGYMETPPELVLESHSRDKLYSEILQEAAQSRPDHEKKSKKNGTSKITDRPAEASRSPLSETAAELIWGEDKNTEDTKIEPKKKRQSYQKR